LEGSGYSEYKGYEDQVQAVEDQARALERIAEDIRELLAERRENEGDLAETAREQGVAG
jgi:hypothetical protein